MEIFWDVLWLDFRYLLALPSSSPCVAWLGPAELSFPVQQIISTLCYVASLF